ncbi:MAG: MFS transporter [Candidatus Peribacter sp.]|nr:MFS transporter [Candidatus Peribacter sp.]
MNSVEKNLKRNLSLLKWLSIDETLFASAIVIAFEMHAIGLSLSQVLLGESIFALTILIVDIPTSVFSDLVHRKGTFIASELCLLVGVIVLAFAQNFFHIIISQIFWGIGLATISGTNSAMLFDTLRGIERENEHRKILGGITSFSLITIAFGQVLSGFLGEINLRLPIFLCILIPIYKLILIIFLQEPPREPHPHALAPLTHVLSALQWFITNSTILLLVIGSIFVSLAWKISAQTFNPYMELIHVPIVYWGVLMACFNLIAAFISRKAHIIQQYLGEGYSFLAIFGGSIIMFVLMANIKLPIGFLFPGIIWIISPFRQIFFADELNKRTSSDRRATTLSIAGFCSQFLQVLALPLFGLFADLWGLPMMYLIIACSLLVVAIGTGFGLQNRLA